jgi:hypothetical protein
MTSLNLSCLSAALGCSNGFFVAVGTSIQTVNNYRSFNERIDLARLEYHMLKDTRESLWQRFENGDPPDSLKTAFIKTNILLEKEAVDSTWFCRPPLPRLLGGVCVAGILSRMIFCWWSRMARRRPSG